MILYEVRDHRLSEIEVVLLNTLSDPWHDVIFRGNHEHVFVLLRHDEKRVNLIFMRTSSTRFGDGVDEVPTVRKHLRKVRDIKEYSNLDADRGIERRNKPLGGFKIFIQN